MLQNYCGGIGLSRTQSIMERGCDRWCRTQSIGSSKYKNPKLKEKKEDMVKRYSLSTVDITCLANPKTAISELPFTNCPLQTALSKLPFPNCPLQTALSKLPFQNCPLQTA